jgi:hypothetical protein
VDDMQASAPRDDRHPEFARVKTPAPASASDPLFVTVASFDGGYQKHGPCMWEPPAGALPQVGELCVIVRAIEEDGEGEQAVVIAFDRDVRSAKTPPLVNELPDDPIDGDEIYFQTPAMAALGIVWRFRFNADSALSEKWECVGGDDIAIGPQGGDSSVTSTALAALTAGPTIAVPLAGVYQVGVAANIQSTATGLFEGLVQARVGSGGTVLAQARVTGNNTFDGAELTGIPRRASLAAGNVVSLFRKNSTAVATSYGGCSLFLKPVRVG